MLMRVPDQTTEVTLARMVMPRSRSRSFESSDALGHALVLAKRAGLLEKRVDEGGLPLVDMGDDGDIAKLHGIRNVQRGPERPAVHTTTI